MVRLLPRIGLRFTNIISSSFLETRLIFLAGDLKLHLNQEMSSRSKLQLIGLYMDYTTQLYRDYNIAIIRIPSSTNEDFMVHVIQTGFGDCYGVLGGQEVGEQLVEKMAGRLDTMLEDESLPLEREQNHQTQRSQRYENLPRKKIRSKIGSWKIRWDVYSILAVS